MTIEFRCDCGSRLRVPERLAGRIVRCPACEEPTSVPKVGEDPYSYSLDGAIPNDDGTIPSVATTAQSPAGQLAKSTYRAARMSEPPTSMTAATAWRSASRGRRHSDSPWLASFWFPFRAENKFTLLGWGIGFTTVTIMMSVPMPFLIANVCRLFILLVAAGYFFHFLSEVVRTAAGGDNYLPETSSGDDVFSDAVNWWGAVVIGLFPWWGFQFLNWWFVLNLPAEIGHGLLLAGVLYIPMALLATTLFGSVLAANPVYVLGAIFKLPLQYLSCCLLSAGVLAVYLALDALITAALGPESLLLGFLIHSISGLLLLYVSIVVMHQLGSVYHRNRVKFGWFRD